MKLQDSGILIHKKPLGESKWLACFFTEKHGKVVGVLRRSSKQPLDLGTKAAITWSARLEDQLGTLSIEPTFSPAAFCVGSFQALLALQSSSSLLYDMLAEKHPYEKLYQTCLNFLQSLRTDWQSAYAFFELTLLRELGFGLDLSACAVTGKTEDLTYISPKSGRAVCEVEGRLYKDKLLPYPTILHNETASLGDALFTFGYFLQKHFYAAHNKKLPQARVQLIEILSQYPHKKAS